MNDTGMYPVLTGHEVRELQLLIEQRSGIVFDESRERFLTSRVVEQMQRKRLTYGVELLRLVRASTLEYDNMLERLLTQETRFFRYPGLFTAFEQHVLPELQARKVWDADHALRILSAGCSSGEEPYSIALSICEAVEPGTDLKAAILATDISREALERAESATYSSRTLENLSPEQIDNYFIRRGDAYEVKPLLLEMVKFTPMNLAQPMYVGRYECIFCMNVLIYFSSELRSKLIQRFYECLEPGGYIFLGHAESVASVPVRFKQIFMHGARLLQKPLDEARAVGEEL